MKRLISLIGVCILLICTPCKAEITPQLITEWSRQPSNVQWNVFYQNTNIQVVDNLGWQSATLYDTYAYTTLNVSNGLVNSIDMRIKRGYEFALTHEVGHCISNANRTPYWWCYQPCFIQIWQQEKYNCVLLVGQGSTDIREYFAEAYNLYINYTPILKKCCPSTYNYMKVVLQNT
jgi:hypothetical protein